MTLNSQPFIAAIVVNDGFFSQSLIKVSATKSAASISSPGKLLPRKIKQLTLEGSMQPGENLDITLQESFEHILIW